MFRDEDRVADLLACHCLKYGNFCLVLWSKFYHAQVTNLKSRVGSEIYWWLFFFFRLIFGYFYRCLVAFSTSLPTPKARFYFNFFKIKCPHPRTSGKNLPMILY